MDLGGTFGELAALLALAAAMGAVGMILRQPLVVAFIVAGILAGGDVLSIVRSPDHIAVLAEIGIAVLLFLVGLKLDIQIIRSVGAVALATGIGQIAFTAVIGLGVCLMLGFDLLTSTYIAVALTFSSTIIVVKLLSDKRELDSLHGRVALGFLIVQDIAVVVAMVALSAFGVGMQENPAGLGLGGVLGAAVAMLAFVVVFVRYLAEPLLRRLGSMPELLLTFSLAWAVLFAALGDWLGFGKELGGLLAGMSLASTTMREAIASRLSSLRDFLLLFFFIALGSQLDLGLLGAQVQAAVLLSVFVLIGNPLIVLAIMGYMGFRRRTGFLAGLTVAQISEFSLIFMAMGLSLGHVNEEALGLVTLVGLTTITLSTYMIIHSQTLYQWLDPLLVPFERRVPARELALEDGPAGHGYDVIMFGLGRYGREIARILQERGTSVLGVDFDPEAVERFRRNGLTAVYGDANDSDFPASLPLAHAQWVLVAIPPINPGITATDNRAVLIESLRQAGYRGKIAVRSHDEADLHHVSGMGSDFVLMPFLDAAERFVERLGLAPDDRGAAMRPYSGRGQRRRPRNHTKSTAAE